VFWCLKTPEAQSPGLDIHHRSWREMNPSHPSYMVVEVGEWKDGIRPVVVGEQSLYDRILVVTTPRNWSIFLEWESLEVLNPRVNHDHSLSVTHEPLILELFSSSIVRWKCVGRISRALKSQSSE
jgi:hypothetical protein